MHKWQQAQAAHIQAAQLAQQHRDVEEDDFSGSELLTDDEKENEGEQYIRNVENVPRS